MLADLFIRLDGRLGIISDRVSHNGGLLDKVVASLLDYAHCLPAQVVLVPHFDLHELVLFWIHSHICRLLVIRPHCRILWVIRHLRGICVVRVH